MTHDSRQPEDEVERSHLCSQAGSRESELEVGLGYKPSSNLTLSSKTCSPKSSITTQETVASIGNKMFKHVSVGTGSHEALPCTLHFGKFIPVSFLPYHATSWMYLLYPAFSLSTFLSPVIYCPSSVPSPTQASLVSYLLYAL